MVEVRQTMTGMQTLPPTMPKIDLSQSYTPRYGTSGMTSITPTGVTFNPYVAAGTPGATTVLRTSSGVPIPAFNPVELPKSQSTSPLQYLAAIEEAGKRYIGIGGLPGTPAFITGERIRQAIAQSGVKFPIPIYFTGTNTPGGIIKSDVPTKMIAELVPTTPSETALMGIGSVTPFFNPWVRYPIEGAFTYMGGKTFLNKELPTEQRLLGGGVAALGGVGLATGLGPTIYQRLPFVKKPKIEIPSEELIKLTEPTTRKSARVFLIDEKGNYIMGKKPNGEIISLGGKIEKGDTARITVKKEFLQETGSKLPKGKLKYEGKMIFPEETFEVFTFKIKEADVLKLKGSSDVSGGIVRMSPSKFKGVTGMTPYNPVDYKGVRIYESSIINWLESGKKIKPTWMYSETPQGKFYYGTQSRYDVPANIIKSYGESPEPLLFAHGTKKLPIKETWFGKPKLSITKEAWLAGGGRGEPGLYLQPPISKIGKAGYIGLSYLGYGKPTEYSIGFKPAGTRGALLFEEYAKEPIIFTKKALKGKESEMKILVGTEIKTSGKPKSEWIGGKRVILQPAEIIKSEKISQSKIGNLGDELKVTKYISPYEMVKTIVREDKLKSYKTSSYKIPSYKLSGYKVPSYKIPSYKTPSKYKLPEYKTPSYKIPYKTPNYKIPSYKTPNIKTPNYKTPNIKTPKIPNIPRHPIIKSGASKSSESKKISKKLYAYQPYVRKRGKFIAVGLPMEKGKALRRGELIAKRTAAVTFKVVPTAKTVPFETKYVPSKEFRTFKIVKGIPVQMQNQFIQRRKFRISSYGEKLEIPYTAHKQRRIRW